ncbi:MAG TPA: methyl-accepting chemotaxis protein, partial [Chloroflexota bacterium]
MIGHVRSLKIAHRLMGSSLLLLLLMGLTVAIGGLTLHALTEQIDELTTHDVPSIVLLLNIDRDAYQAQLALEASLLAVDPAERDKLLAAFRENAQQTWDRWQQYKDIALRMPGEEEVWRLYEADRAAWLAQAEQVAAQSAAGTDTAVLYARGRLPEIRAQFDAMRERLNQLQDTFYDPRVQAVSGDVREGSAGAQAQMLSSLAVAVLLGLGLAWLTARSISRPLAAVTEAARRMALGDLDVRFGEEGRRDEIGQMTGALGAMLGYLHQVARTAEGIARGDLTVGIAPRSERDALGNALSTMVANLRAMVGAVQRSGAALQATAGQLEQAASQTGQATQQVATAITGVGQGAQAQARAAQ